MSLAFDKAVVMQQSSHHVGVNNVIAADETG